MQNQKLCLKWNNHTTNLLSVLGGFQKEDILVDVTISCEGKNIKAHKMVLSACSPFFQNMFLDNPCQHPIIIISGMKYDDVTAILNFMYNGEVNVSHDGLSSFLQAAETLKVKGLAEVCGERRSTNSISEDVQSDENRPQRTDTPPRKRQRNRKRSLSDSNRSDDEGSRKQIRERSSPEVHELSGDESFTGDNNSNGPPFNSVPRVPKNLYSRSHQSSSNMVGEEDEEYEVEPSKLLEQTLTTESVSMNNSTDNNLRIERIVGNATTEMESSSLQEPDSPPDIKPIIDYGESSAGPSDGSMMLYNEQSQPGPSNMQDGSLLHDNSHAQGKLKSMSQVAKKNCLKYAVSKAGTSKMKLKNKQIKKKFQSVKKLPQYKCNICKFATSDKKQMATHLYEHENCRSIYVRNHSDNYACYHCQFRTDEKSEIKSHLLTEESNKQHFINRNFESSKRTNEYSAHYVCDICNQGFTNLERFDMHRQYVHVHEKECTMCNKRFSDMNAYLSHVEQHKANMKK